MGSALIGPRAGSHAKQNERKFGQKPSVEKVNQLSNDDLQDRLPKARKRDKVKITKELNRREVMAE